MEAWEHGEDKRYIPVKFKNGEKTLAGMAKQLRQGSIAADPFYRGQQENACLNCDYFDACHFSDGENGESCRYLPKLSDEQVWEMLDGGGGRHG